MREERTDLGRAAVAGPFASPVMADEVANEALVSRFYRAVNARNLDAFDELAAADFVDHNAAPGTPQGVAGLKNAIGMLATAFPDLTISTEFMISKGDRVVVYASGAGTHGGPLLGVPATRRPVMFHGSIIWLVRNGKLAEVWRVEEMLQVMLQIGAFGV
jgi:predicted ester cyclase